jgi:hypothetical protein
MGPVNQQVREATIIAKRDQQVWLKAGEGPEDVYRGWMTQEFDNDLAQGSSAVVYVDTSNKLNGWWAKESKAGVNQRHHEDSDAEAGVVYCRDGCGLPWVAPAANKLVEHGERCLACDSPLAP